MQGENKVTSRSTCPAAADQIKSTAFNRLLAGPVQGIPEDTGLAWLTLQVSTQHPFPLIPDQRTSAIYPVQSSNSFLFFFFLASLSPSCSLVTMFFWSLKSKFNLPVDLHEDS